MCAALLFDAMMQPIGKCCSGADERESDGGVMPGASLPHLAPDRWPSKHILSAFNTAVHERSPDGSAMRENRIRWRVMFILFSAFHFHWWKTEQCRSHFPHEQLESNVWLNQAVGREFSSCFVSFWFHLSVFVSSPVWLRWSHPDRAPVLNPNICVQSVCKLASNDLRAVQCTTHLSEGCWGWLSSSCANSSSNLISFSSPDTETSYLVVYNKDDLITLVLFPCALSAPEPV